MPAARGLTGADTSKVDTKDSIMKRPRTFKIAEGFGLSELLEMFQKDRKSIVYCSTSNKN